MTDPKAVSILSFFIGDTAIAEHDGAPPLDAHLLWGLFASYTENFVALGVPGLRPRIPDGAPASGVTALEALAAGRVLAEQLRACHGWITAEARKDGATWAEIGDALGMTRQSAWEGFAKFAADPAHGPWPALRAEYRELAAAPADS